MAVLRGVPGLGPTKRPDLVNLKPGGPEAPVGHVLINRGKLPDLDQELDHGFPGRNPPSGRFPGRRPLRLWRGGWRLGVQLDNLFIGRNMLERSGIVTSAMKQKSARLTERV